MFGAESVQLLDAMLRVSPIATHIPFAGAAVDARNRIGLPHDADDEVARCHPRPRRCLEHLAERFVAKDEPVGAWRRGTVLAAHDLAFGAAEDRKSTRMNSS